MAGSEQHPTDEVEGHTWHHAQDTEGVDDNRGHRLPDDAEGHGLRLPPEAVDEDRGTRYPDDAEGHGYRWGQDAEAVDEDQVGDDTEGHSRR
jgi:hypothetical protein